jgi:hypothetical protein
MQPSAFARRQKLPSLKRHRLPPRREEHGGEIRSGPVVLLSRLKVRVGIGVRFDRLAIEMPRRVAEHRKHHREAEKNGTDPITSSAVTIKPHKAMVTGFAATTRIEVSSATAAPTSRSSSNGKEITLMVSVSTAKRNPTLVPTMMSFHPAGVVNTSSAN